MKERIVMRDTTIDYRTTKEVIEAIVKRSNFFSDFHYKTIFTNDKMFYCVRPENGENIYEVKVTRKKRINDEVLVGDGLSDNSDPNKKLYLSQLKTLLNCVFPRNGYHEGNILINDNNSDYVISLIKKMKISWE